MKKTLIIYSHPKKDSLNGFFLENIQEIFKDKKENLKIVDLYNDNFDPCLKLEREETNSPQIKKYQDLITWSERIIFIFPIWWGGYPAILKGFFDKVLTPHFAYKYSERGIPIKLLKGREAILIRTAGGPKFYIKYLVGDGSYKILKKTTLEFCGIKVKENFTLYGVNLPSFNEDKTINLLIK